MTEPRPKEPRVEHPAYLAWVRQQPCTVSHRAPPSDAAHLRCADPRHNKPLTGMQRKPHDWFVLPLDHELHMEQHAFGDELGWWASKGIPDPVALALALYASRPPMAPPRERRRRKSRARKPRSQRKAVGKSRPMQSRGFSEQHRKLVSRNDMKRPTK